MSSSSSFSTKRKARLESAITLEVSSYNYIVWSIINLTFRWILLKTTVTCYSRCAIDKKVSCDCTEAQEIVKNVLQPLSKWLFPLTHPLPLLPHQPLPPSLPHSSLAQPPSFLPPSPSLLELFVPVRDEATGHHLRLVLVAEISKVIVHQWASLPHPHLFVLPPPRDARQKSGIFLRTWTTLDDDKLWVQSYHLNVDF